MSATTNAPAFRLTASRPRESDVLRAVKKYLGYEPRVPWWRQRPNEIFGLEYLKKLRRARKKARLMLSRMKAYEAWAAETGNDSEDGKRRYENIRAILIQHIDDLHPDRPHHRMVKLV